MGGIIDIIKKEKFYVGRILEDISDFMIKSQRRERLNDFASLNYWGALGRHISEFYSTSETARKAMEYIVDTFNKIKQEIETDQLPEQARNYKEIKNQVESLKKYLEMNNKVTGLPISKKIDNLICSFKAASEPSDFKIVKWGEVNVSAENKTI